MTQVCYLATEYNHFLSRELKWTFVQYKDGENPPELQKTNENVIWVLLIGNDPREIESFSEFYTEKIWVYLYGDETFDPKLNFAILRNRNVLGSIRPFSLPQSGYLTTQLKWIGSSFRFLKTNKYSVIRVIDLVARGQAMISRQFFCKALHRIFQKKDISVIPGYTNLFADSFLLRFSSQSMSTSLIEIGKSNVLGTVRSRRWPISFVGQRGNISRQNAITIAQSLLDPCDFNCVVREKFGGTKGSYDASEATANEFISILSQSRFSLCPGGNYSMATFRLLESVILGAIPLVSLQSTTDPGYELPFGATVLATRGGWFDELSRDLDIDIENWRSLSLQLLSEVETFLFRVDLTLKEKSSPGT